MLRLILKILILTLLLAFCIYPTLQDAVRSSSHPDAITLRFWNGFTGPDGRTILGMIQKFSKENPDIHIIMQKMTWDEYYNKLFVAGVAGRCPDVFVIHSHTLPRFTGAKFVRTVDDLVGTGPGQLDPADFDPNIWAAMEHAGHHWAIPLDVHPLGMYYNRTLFRQAGIVDAQGNPKPPVTRDEFLADLRKLKQPATNGHPGQWGFAFGWLRTNTYAILRQFGGSLFDDSLSHSTFNSPANIRAIQWCADLILKDQLVPSVAFDSWIAFRQGRIGMTFEGIYMLPDLQRQTDLDWGAAPLPLLGEQEATWAGSHSLALRADLTGRQLRAAMRFIKFLSDNSLDWAEGGKIPVRRSLRDSDRFRAMYAQREFAKEIPYVRYFPASPFIFEFLTEYQTSVDLALRGTATPADALNGASVRIDSVIDRYRREGWEISR